MTSNVFDNARRLVSSRDVAERYGFHPNRANFIECPFHNEKTASLKLYEDGGWYCFGCHTRSSSIDFVAKLFDLAPLEAVRKMNAEFNLALSLDKPPSTAQQKAIQHRQRLHKVKDFFEKWQDGAIDLLNSAYREGHLILQNWPDNLSAQEVMAVKWHEALEYWSDILISDNLEKKMEIYRDWSEIENLCYQITNRTLMKSNVA